MHSLLWDGWCCHHPSGGTTEPNQRTLSDTPPHSQDTLHGSPSTPSNKKPFLHLPCGLLHPSIGISGQVRYGQSGQWRTGSEGGRDFQDYPAAFYCLINGNTEAHDGQESDSRSQRDSLTLFMLTPPPYWRVVFTSTPDLMTSCSTLLPGDPALFPIGQITKLNLKEDK